MQDLNLSETTFDEENMRVLNQMTDVTAQGLALVPKKDRMLMMRVGKGAMTAKQLDEMMEMYPKTQIFDPSGYWRPERIEAAMKELGKEYPPKK